VERAATIITGTHTRNEGHEVPEAPRGRVRRPKACNAGEGGFRAALFFVERRNKVARTKFWP
jgi:hypothetical protein